MKKRYNGWKNKEDALNYLELVIKCIENHLEGKRSKVLAVDEVGDIRISTIVAVDTELPETAVIRENGKWIAVAVYETEEEALIGHQKWKDRKDWPSHLYDVNSKQMEAL